MLSTWQFYALWVVYFLGTSVGLTAIGEATPLLQEMARTSAVMSAGAALGVMSIFTERAGSVGQRIGSTGRRNAVLCMCVVSDHGLPGLSASTRPGSGCSRPVSVWSRSRTVGIWR